MAVIDVESLVQELSPEAPSGKDLEYDAAFLALVEKAKGTPEQQIGDRVEPAVPPNWKEVGKECVRLLGTTHDLRLVWYLIQALLRSDGYAGFAEGLALLRAMLETFWDSVHPQLDPEDDNDPTQRINILTGLCDFDNILRPALLATLVESRALGRFSLRDVHIATGKLPAPAGGEAPQLTTINAAFSDADIDSLQDTESALAGCLDSLGEIETYVTGRVGVGNAPSFAPLRDLLRDARHVLQDQLSRRGAGPQAEPAEAQEPVEFSAGAETRAAAAPGTIRSREDVVRSLDLICDYYSRFEPSSPVPLLLKRARRLVSKDFMEIMMDLAPDALGQVQMIKGYEPDEG